jgi:hypothetical protein
MSNIEADFTDLLKQAPMTVEGYFSAAHKYLKSGGVRDPFIDTPELVAAFVNAASRDFGASVIAKALFEIADKEAGVDHSYELQGIADALKSVSDSVFSIATAAEYDKTPSALHDVAQAIRDAGHE